MTICVAVAVYDGVVFAADSASSLLGQNPQTGEPIVTNVYGHGNKVFNLVRGLPLVGMTCGVGNFSRANIATLTKDLRRSMSTPGEQYYVDPKAYTVKEVAEKAKDFFGHKYSEIQPPLANPHSFDYWVSGFPSSTDIHEIYNIHIESGVSSPLNLSLPSGECGLVWGGQPEAINRLVMGFGSGAIDALIGAGMNKALALQVMTVAQAKTQASLVQNSMPIQDAIDLAEFLVDVTKRFVRFLPGADIVGGETDVAVVTRHERFKWIRRKHYYPAHLNLLETDHV